MSEGKKALKRIFAFYMEAAQPDMLRTLHLANEWVGNNANKIVSLEARVEKAEAERDRLRNALSGLIVKIESMAFNDQHKPHSERTCAEYLTRQRVFEIAKAALKDTQP